MQVHPTFLEQLEAIFIAFLTPVMSALGIWIVFKLRTMATDFKSSTEELKANQQKIADQTNGINEKILKRSDDHTRALIDSKNAEIHAKDAAISAKDAALDALRKVGP